MATYRNPWHEPFKGEYGPRVYECSAEPTKYRGYLIYHRIAFDVVKAGACVGQYHGLSGAKRFIDNLLDGKDEVAVFCRNRVAEYFSQPQA